MTRAAPTFLSAIALMTSLACGVANAAEATREVHGASDAFAMPGVALAWGVLRGTDDATVVIRVASDPQRYRFVGIEGVDPFTQRRAVVWSPVSFPGDLDVRVARAHFAEFPRTEFHFFVTEESMRNGAPELVVFYNGVPDTTPELGDAAQLEASLATRLERARAEAKKKAP